MRALAALTLGLLLAAGCGVSSPDRPGPSSIAVDVTSAEGVGFAGPLRLAVLFGAGDTNVDVSDVPATVGARVEVPLEVPPGSWEERVWPLEQAILPSLSALDVYRPRIVLYADADRSGDFLPQASGGTDVVAAIDTAGNGPGVGAVLDLDEALSRMTLEENEAFYAASGGVYTPFVRVQGTRGQLELVSAESAGALELRATDSPVPAEHLSCGRDAVYLYGDPLAPADRVTAHLDDGITPAEFCGPTIPSCDVAPLAGLAPDLTAESTDARRRVVQCRRSDTYEVVVAQLAVLECEDCLCTYGRSAEVWVATAGATPSWWPCGTTLDTCDSTMPLYQIDPACVPAPG